MMHFYRVVINVGVLTVGTYGPRPMLGQDLALAVGDSVRFRVASQSAAPWTHGRVFDVTDSGFTVRQVPDPDPLRPPQHFAWMEVTQLAMSRGTRSNEASGLLIGAVIGGGVGAIIGGTNGAVIRIDCESNCDPGLGDALVGGAVLGTLGAALGYLWGGQVHSERWDAVAVPLVGRAAVERSNEPITGRRPA